MAYTTKMLSCSSLKEEYGAIDAKAPKLQPEIQKSLSARLETLSAEERNGLNLAAHYSLSGQADIVLAVLSTEHPMRDLFNEKGEPDHVQSVRYVSHVFEKQMLQNEISRLNVCEI